jgi:hypothetical protein
VATTRRGFLKKSLLGVGFLAIAGAVPLALRRGRLRPLPAGATLLVLTEGEYSVLTAVADCIFAPLAPGQPTPDVIGVALKIDALMAGADPDSQRDFKQLLDLFENALPGLLWDGRPTPFTERSPEEQTATLERWRFSRLPLRRSGFQALQRLCNAVYYSDPATYAGIGYPGPPLLARADGTLVGGLPGERP